MILTTLIEKAQKELTTLTGLPASSTTEAVKDPRGWRIGIELVEKKAIPDQMDILALYEGVFDEEGNLLSFHRKSMRKRMDIV